MSSPAMVFAPAERAQSYLRLGIIGPAGSGKSLTGLRLARGIMAALGLPEGRFAAIDTEHGSLSKYATLPGQAEVPGRAYAFDSLSLTSFSPDTYIDAIAAARRAKYPVLLIDSLTHAWAGTEGALEQLDKAQGKYGGNRWAAWADVTPMHNRLIEAMLGYPGHLIATMRSKVEWAEQTNGGRKTYERIGTSAIQREGMEYEFDLVGDIDLAHVFVVSKSRFPEFDHITEPRPSEELAEKIVDVLMHGAPMPKAEPDHKDALAEVGAALAGAGLKGTDLHALIPEAKRGDVLAWLRDHEWSVKALIDATVEKLRAPKAEEPAAPAAAEPDVAPPPVPEDRTEAFNAAIAAVNGTAEGLEAAPAPEAKRARAPRSRADKPLVPTRNGVAEPAVVKDLAALLAYTRFHWGADGASAAHEALGAANLTDIRRVVDETLGGSWQRAAEILRETWGEPESGAAADDDDDELDGPF